MRNELPPSLKAIGREPLPVTLVLQGVEYALVRVFKHDFFAVTALYQGPEGKAVVKIGRKADFFGLPCGWIGRLHTQSHCALAHPLGFSLLRSLDRRDSLRRSRGGRSRQQDRHSRDQRPDGRRDRRRTGLLRLLAIDSCKVRS